MSLWLINDRMSAILTQYGDKRSFVQSSQVISHRDSRKCLHFSPYSGTINLLHFSSGDIISCASLINPIHEPLCGAGKEVRLILTKTGKGEGSDIYMEYSLKNAIISSYEVGGSTDDTNRPIENITISFVEIEARYTPYDDNGNAMAACAVGFDTATNNKKSRGYYYGA